MGYKFLLGIFVGFLVVSSSCFSADFIETETHFYIITYDPRGLVEVKRETGEERFIPLKELVSSIFYHENTIYLFKAYGSLTRFDPLSDTQSIVCSELGEGFRKLYLFDHFALLYGTTNLSIVDLSLGKIVKNVPSSRIVRVLHNDQYLFCSLSNANHCLVLDKSTLEEVKSIEVGRLPNHMVIHDCYLYVANSESCSLSVIHLVELKVVKKISVGSLPKSMVKHGHHLYVKNRLDNGFSIIDLESQEVSTTLNSQLDKALLQSRLRIREGIGYILSWGAKEIWIIDVAAKKTLLIKKCVEKSILNPKLSLTDQFVYIDGHKVMPLVCIDIPGFDVPLFADNLRTEGVDFYDDGEAAFKALCQETDSMLAQGHLKHALECAHPKAYALAAFAYLHEKWGAKVNLVLHQEYLKSADKTYYSKLFKLVQAEDTLNDDVKKKQDAGSSHSTLTSGTAHEDWDLEGFLAGRSWGGY